MLKVRLKNIYNKLSVFDFDGTLFKSPDKPKNYDGNWWANKESLGHPNVPKKPDDKFWNMDVVNSAKKELQDKNTYCIFMTGRVDQFFDDRIRELLKQKKLNFDLIKLCEFGKDTGEFKIGEINKLLKKFPSIKKIEMWEDEPEKVELYTNQFDKDYLLKINKVDKYDAN